MERFCSLLQNAVAKSRRYPYETLHQEKPLKVYTVIYQYIGKLVKIVDIF